MSTENTEANVADKLAQALRKCAEAAWHKDSHRVHFDSTVAFGPHYNFCGLDGIQREEFLGEHDCIVWPCGSGRKWSAYCTYQGSMWFEKFDTVKEAKAVCMELLAKVSPNDPFVKAHAVLAAHEAEKAQVALTYEEEYLAGALLVNKETRKRIMFYSANMLPNPATLEDRFELVKVYTRPAPAAPASASEAPVAVPMWREIATAPKDGTSVLLCWAIDDDGGPIDWRKDLKTAQVFVKVASWWAGENDWVTYCNHAHEPLVYFEPTHWMPLPAPPHAAPAAPVAVPMTDELVGKLLRTQSALSKMTKKYGEIGSRDVDVARWNTDLCEAIRAVGDVLADQPLEQLARIKLEGGQG